MDNYYEDKFSKLKKILGTKKALSEIVKILLYQSSQPKLGVGEDKYSVFWCSHFIDLLTADLLRTEHYSWALCQYIRSGRYSEGVLRKLFFLEVDGLIYAIRLSGVISDFKRDSWDVLVAFLRTLNDNKILNFINVSNEFRMQYKEWDKIYLELYNKLNFTQLTALSFAGVYGYQFLVGKDINNDIPYSIYMGEKYPFRTQDIWTALDEIIQQSQPEKFISEKDIVLNINNKVLPLLKYSCDSIEVMEEYRQFCQLVASKICLNILKNEIIPSFCYSIFSGFDQENDKFEEKFGILILFNEFNGLAFFNQSEVLNRAVEKYYNKEAFSRYFSILFWIEEIYGIKGILTENNKSMNLGDTVRFLTAAQSFSTNFFVSQFLSLRFNHDISFRKSLLMMMVDGLKNHKMRSVFTFHNFSKLSHALSGWISGNEKKTVRSKKMMEILEFWTCDLNSNKKSTSFSEKPFYRINDFIFSFPHRLSWQNLYITSINRIRKTNKNNRLLRKETALIEENLFQLFKCYSDKFHVECSFIPSDLSVGEMDLIVVQDETVLLVELKSSFVRTHLQEIYAYRFMTLNKASYQLDKKLDYLKKYYSDKRYFHTWIVDTTLEFDHKYIGSHLKISLEELVIILRNGTHFLKEIKTIYETMQERDTDSELNCFDNESPSNRNWSLTLNKLIEVVESNAFWEENLKQYELMSKYF